MARQSIPVPSATAGYNVKTWEEVVSATTVQVHYMIPCIEKGTISVGLDGTTGYITSVIGTASGVTLFTRAVYYSGSSVTNVITT